MKFTDTEFFKPSDIPLRYNDDQEGCIMTFLGFDTDETLDNELFSKREQGSISETFRLKEDIFLKSISEYEKQIKKDPENPVPYNGIGIAFSGLGLYDKAEYAFKKSLKLAPKYTYANYNIGLLYLKLGRYTEAEEEFKKHLKNNPNDVYALNRLGMACLNNKKIDEAKKILLKSFSINEMDYVTLNNLGLVFEQENNLTKSEYYFKKAISFSIKYIEARNNLGRILAKQKKWDEAEKELLKILIWCPNSSSAYCNLGILNLVHHKWSEAVKNIQKATEINPVDIYSKNILALAYLKLGEINKSLNQLDEALKIKEDDLETLSNKAYCLYSAKRPKEALYYASTVALHPNSSNKIKNLCGILSLIFEKYDEAKFYFKKVLDKNENDIPALLNLSLCFIEKEEFEKAIFLSRRALKLDNNNINAINTYALALFHAGYTQDAIEILNKIKDENSDDYYTNSNLGLFFTSLKKYFEAEKYYQILLKKYPEDCEVLNNLGYIYSKTGREAFAEKLWRDALRIDSSYIPARKNLEYIGYFLSNAGRNRNYNNIILL